MPDTPNGADMTDLLERVLKLTGPDREVDRLLTEVLNYPNVYRNDDGTIPFTAECARFTSSVDAALALVERVLPGWVVLLDQYPDHWTVNLAEYRKGYGVWGDDFDATAKTAPLAILAALLTAKAQP